ncbi:MAG: hypothetical protein LBL94_07380 [Prevotellaceae bacterium]|jgi:hypothetical protein|nr:hypothetical protein [Prevotellaceae bacterium]
MSKAHCLTPNVAMLPLGTTAAISLSSQYTPPLPFKSSLTVHQTKVAAPLLHIFVNIADILRVTNKVL